jgi:hypothetical protein
VRELSLGKVSTCLAVLRKQPTYVFTRILSVLIIHAAWNEPCARIQPESIASLAEVTGEETIKLALDELCADTSREMVRGREAIPLLAQANVVASLSDTRESQRCVHAQWSIVSGDHTDSSPNSKINGRDETETSEEQSQLGGDHGDKRTRIRCTEPSEKNMRTQSGVES